MPGFGRGRSRDRGRRGTPGLERKPPHRRWGWVSPYVLGEREATRAENAARAQKNARGVCRKKGTGFSRFIPDANATHSMHISHLII